MEENTLYYQNITEESYRGAEISDLPIDDCFDSSLIEQGKDSWILGAPGKPGDVGGKIPDGPEAILSDALPFTLLLVVVYVFVMRKRRKATKENKLFL